MTKGELIKALQDMDCPNDTTVYVFDHKLNLSTDCSDGSSEGIYDFSVEYVNQAKDRDKETVDFYIEQYEKEPTPVIVLTFDNPDIEI